MSDYPRGSEWRRWDLHIHTPGTNKNDLLLERTGRQRNGANRPHGEKAKPRNY